MRKGDETLRGERILYDLESEQGTILSGQIYRDKGFYAGRVIQTRSRRISTYMGARIPPAIGNTRTSTSIAPKSRFSARWRLLAQSTSASPSAGCYGFPSMSFSARGSSVRNPDPQFRQPTSALWRRPNEWELRNLGYYLAPNDYWDLALSTDLRQRSGWLGRARFNYAVRYAFRGRINAQLEIVQQGRNIARNWRLEFNHSQS